MTIIIAIGIPIIAVGVTIAVVGIILSDRCRANPKGEIIIIAAVLILYY